MKRINLLTLFVPLLVSTTIVNADSKPQVPIWPSNMNPYTYQWPMQQPMQQPMLSGQSAPMATGFPANYGYPMYQGRPLYNANTMRPPQNYPAMPRMLATQTHYPYAPPMNNTANNTAIPVPQGQYRYPLQYGQNAKAPAHYVPYRKPMQAQNNFKKKQKPWGDTRYIWPDFYTDATGDMWDNMVNAPYDMGRMPGGWQFPSLSSPDPVTVGDAVSNQFPPIMDEMPNFMPFMN